MNRMKHLTLRGLIRTDEQTRQRMAAARTPETRTRIRRWSRVESISMMAMAVGFALILIAPLASIGVAVWMSVTGVDHPELYWWIWGATIIILVGGIIVSLFAGGHRERACFADGYVAVGNVQRAIEHPGSGDDATWFDLRISAELSVGVTLRRRLHFQGEGFGRRVGRPVRFRHNTFDPDDLDDILFDGWDNPELRSA